MNNFRERESNMPAVFVGHGSPTYAIEQNRFVDGWRRLGAKLPWPEAILCISAHWESKGTFVTTAEKPETIHDFYGFADELYKTEYRAAGSPILAELIRDSIKSIPVEFDFNRGFDHGCWAVLRNIYPEADIPVVQLSLDRYHPPEWHYKLGKELTSLRNKGVLVIGSGNLIHNLGMIDWHNTNSGYDWALDINGKFKQLILEGRHEDLIDYNSISGSAKLAVPTPEHFLPLLYILAMKEKEESIHFFNDEVVLGSLSMTSLIIG